MTGIFLLNLPRHAFVPMNVLSAQRASKQNLVAFVPTVVVSLCHGPVGRRPSSQRTHRHVCVCLIHGVVLKRPNPSLQLTSQRLSSNDHVRNCVITLIISAQRQYVRLNPPPNPDLLVFTKWFSCHEFQGMRDRFIIYVPEDKKRVCPMCKIAAFPMQNDYAYLGTPLSEDRRKMATTS